MIGLLLCPTVFGKSSAATSNAWMVDVEVSVGEIVAAGHDHPVHVTDAGDGTGRLFVVEQPGMMSQSARDRLTWAALAVANHDAPNGGEYCLRCNAPKG